MTASQESIDAEAASGRGTAIGVIEGPSRGKAEIGPRG
jgi:hypothetical protein